MDAKVPLAADLEVDRKPPDKNNNPRLTWGVLPVEPRGLEPLTPCLQSRCATNCAMAPRGTSQGWSGPPGAGAGGGIYAVGRLGPQLLLGPALLELLAGDRDADGGGHDQQDLLHGDSSLHGGGSPRRGPHRSGPPDPLPIRSTRDVDRVPTTAEGRP